MNLITPSPLGLNTEPLITPVPFKVLNTLPLTTPSPFVFRYLVSNSVVNCAEDDITESPLGLNTLPLITPSPLVFKYLVSKVLVSCADDDITESPSLYLGILYQK